MFEDIDKAIATLAKQDAGWVFRRDSVEALSEAASRALRALKAYADESDVDVQRAVAAALAKASTALAGIVPDAQSAVKEAAPSLEALAYACEKAGKRSVESSGDGYAITVQLKNDRTQTVYLKPFVRKDGLQLIRVYTFCGTVDEETLMWALRTNLKLAQCACAMMKKEDEEQLVLINSYLASEVTVTEIRVAVKEIGHYGDWIEKRHSEEDVF